MEPDRPSEGIWEGGTHPTPGHEVLEPPWAFSPSSLSVSELVHPRQGPLDFQPWQRGRFQKCLLCGTKRAWLVFCITGFPQQRSVLLGPSQPGWREGPTKAVGLGAGPGAPIHVTLEPLCPGDALLPG